MPKVNMMGRGHDTAQPRAQHRGVLRTILLPGIGDVIYSWYKLKNYVDMGYDIEVRCLDCDPKRSHQLLGCLEGMRSFDYVGGFDYANYWLVQVDDLRSPPARSLFGGVPVLHINSWPESGRNISDFMPDFPCQYDLDISTDETARNWAADMLSGDFCDVFLYTSSYRNNINCENHPDPHFWADVAMRGREWVGSSAPLRVFMVGAMYDADLTMDTHQILVDRGIETKLILDERFRNVIELLRGCSLSIAYESGFAMLGDCMRVPSLWFIRRQGGGRDDRHFPYSGSVNPSSLGRWIIPFFNDQTLKDVELTLSSTRFLGRDAIYGIGRT